MRILSYIALQTVLAFLSLSQFSCAPKKAEKPNTILMAKQQEVASQLSPEEAQAILEEGGQNWLYGEGMGSTLLTVGSVIIFPPYGLYLLGNSLLELGGYEKVQITKALPPEGQEGFNEVYSKIAAAPGMVSANIAGENFRDKEELERRCKDEYDEKQKLLLCNQIDAK